MLEAAEVLSDRSCSQPSDIAILDFRPVPLHVSTKHEHVFLPNRVTSRRVMEFCCNRAHGEPEIKPACPVFSFHAAGRSIDNLFRYPRTAPNIFAVKSQLVH
jgi:hypothetical protein